MFISDADQQSSSKQTGSIYIIRNTVNDKVYIGQTTMSVRERFMAHLKPSTHKKRGTYKIYNAMDKYGKENFYYEILEENVPVSELDKKEIAYIKEYDSFDNGYNSTPGGNVRRIHEEYDIRKIIDMVDEGKTSKEIGKYFDVSGATIMRVLHGRGIYFADQIDEELLTLLFYAKLNNKQIAYLMNSHDWTIVRRLRKLGLRRKRKKYLYRTDLNYEDMKRDHDMGMRIEDIAKKYDIDPKTYWTLKHIYEKEQLEKCNDYGDSPSTLEDELPMEVQSNSCEGVKEIVYTNRNIGLSVSVLPLWGAI